MMENAKRVRSSSCLAAVLAAATLLAPPALAQTFGLVADNETDSVNVFDVGTNSVVVSLPIGPLGRFAAVGDTAITPDQTLGFVTDFEFQVWVVDLTTSPPSLATGTNPITISNFGEELSVTPDGRFLLASDGATVQPISVIDIASREEINTYSSGSDINSHDLCDDGTSVLITSFNERNVRRLTLDPVSGALTDTGELLKIGEGPNDEPNNVHCAPGSGSGVVVTREIGRIQSFTVPGLAPVDARTLTAFGVSAVFSPAGDRVYVRSVRPASVKDFTYDKETGALGDMSLNSVEVADTLTFFGMDQLAISAGGDTLYVPEAGSPGQVSLFDAADLTELEDSITDANVVQPTGISMPSLVAFEDFQAVLELDDDDFDDDLELELEGEFTLGAASDGIDPASEEFTLTIGDLSLTLPAGSFKFKAAKQAFVYEEESGGQEIEIEIKLLADRTYFIEAEFEGADLSGLTEPVVVTLSIGDDRGETVAALKLDD